MIKKAIIIVSFGSSNEEGRKKSIDQIETEIKVKYKTFFVCSAFLSEVLLKRVNASRKDKIFSLPQCLLYLARGGYEEVYLQPTFITCGMQYQRMMTLVKQYELAFERVVIGAPLLVTIKDFKDTISAFISEHPVLRGNEAGICMGHGSDDALSVSFATLDYMFKQQGNEQYYVATLRSYPAITDVIKMLKKREYQKIYLYPFTVISGFHVAYDLSGKAEAAWQRLLEREGYEVTASSKGLGEYPGIRSIYLRHVEELVGIDYIGKDKVGQK